VTRSALIPFEGQREATGGGGGERESNQILLQQVAYVLSSNTKAKTLQEHNEHTNQHHRNDPLEVMNATEKEWGELDTRLARYG
jgi:hypothetical protein